MGFIFELLIYICPKSSSSMRNRFFANVCWNLLYEINVVYISSDSVLQKLTFFRL